eukprot:g28551.t1
MQRYPDRNKMPKGRSGLPGYAALRPGSVSKFQTQGGDQDYRWGTCEMQGWRDDMEDRLIVRVPLINDLSMFCICDGHGGQGASSFLEERLVEEMLDLDRPLDATDLIKMFQRL